jgi:tetratricopeptide (TPR) repeat protein
MAEAHFALEKIYTGRGEYNKSLEHLRAGMKIDSSDPTPHYRLAQVYRKLNQPEASERELRIFEERKSNSKK